MLAFVGDHPGMLRQLGAAQTRPWLPWAMAASAAGCVAGFFLFLLAAQALRDTPSMLAGAIASFLVMGVGLVALLAFGAAFIVDPAPLEVRVPMQLPGVRRSERPGPMPPAVGAQWVAPLARAVAGTMATGSSRLMVVAARDRLIHGVPVFTFRWTMTGSQSATTIHPDQRAAFRAVRVRLVRPTRPQRIGPVLLIPGLVRPDRPIGDDCTAGWLDPASQRLLNHPAVRRALLPLSGSWVAIHRTAVVVHDQDLGRGTRPLPVRVDATIALARAIDSALSPQPVAPPRPVVPAGPVVRPARQPGGLPRRPVPPIPPVPASHARTQRLPGAAAEAATEAATVQLASGETQTVRLAADTSADTVQLPPRPGPAGT
jgi:hypothetical protein